MAASHADTIHPGSIFLSVVLPAFNEEKNIADVILEHAEFLPSLGSSIADWEIVCVEDGSNDRTLEILDGLSKRIKRLRIIRHAQNQGIYRSYADLFRSARGTHVYLTASDAQWPAANLTRLLQPILAAEADLVIGVRPNRREVYSLWRLIVSHSFNLLPRLLFSVKTEDAGSIKLGVREVFQFELLSRSPFAEAERIICANQRGYRLGFVEIEFISRSHGKATGAKLSNVFASARDCLKCVWRYKLGGRKDTSARSFNEVKP